MSNDNFEQEPAEMQSDEASSILSDLELDEVVGGMQNQLNKQGEDQPGGANSKTSVNPGKTSLLCNGLHKVY